MKSVDQDAERASRKYEIQQSHGKSLDRRFLRTLERKMLDLKSGRKSLSPDEQEKLLVLEETDPGLSEDIMNRRKWKNVKKDPQEALRKEKSDSFSYWATLNALPKKAVKQCVNKRIIDKDRISCDNILKGLFEDQVKEEAVKEAKRQERLKMRQTLHRRHEQIVELERAAGIRLGS